MNTRQINYDSDKEETARRLLLALSNAGITSSELSEKSGVSKSSISQYCHAIQSPSNLSAPKMARVLGVDPLWLMGFDVPMKPNQFIMTQDKREIEHKQLFLFSLVEELGWDQFHLVDIHESLPKDGKQELLNFADYLIMKYGIQDILKNGNDIKRVFNYKNQND